MKKLILIILPLLFSCQKDETVQPEITPSPKQLRSEAYVDAKANSLQKTAWKGTMTYYITGLVDQTIPILREFSKSTVKWWAYPISIDTVYIRHNSYDISMYFQNNGECNGIPADTTYYRWHGKGQLIGDTLYESGTIKFARYYHGLIQQGTGEFSAKLVFYRKLYNTNW